MIFFIKPHGNIMKTFVKSPSLKLKQTAKTIRLACCENFTTNIPIHVQIKIDKVKTIKLSKTRNILPIKRDKQLKRCDVFCCFGWLLIS